MDDNTAERERIERLLTRTEEDYAFAEEAGHPKEILDLLTAKHERLERKLGELAV
jgi:hypothetical protein